MSWRNSEFWTYLYVPIVLIFHLLRSHHLRRGHVRKSRVVAVQASDMSMTVPSKMPGGDEIDDPVPSQRFKKVLSLARQACLGDIADVATQCCFCCGDLPTFVPEAGLVAEWCQVGCLKHLNFTCESLFDGENPNNERNQEYCQYGAAFASQEGISILNSEFMCSSEGEIKKVAPGDPNEDDNPDDNGLFSTGGDPVSLYLFISAIALTVFALVTLFTAWKIRRRRASSTATKEPEDKPRKSFQPQVKDSKQVMSTLAAKAVEKWKRLSRKPVTESGRLDIIPGEEDDEDANVKNGLEDAAEGLTSGSAKNELNPAARDPIDKEL